MQLKLIHFDKNREREKKFSFRKAPIQIEPKKFVMVCIMLNPDQGWTECKIICFHLFNRFVRSSHSASSFRKTVKEKSFDSEKKTEKTLIR